MPSRKALPQLLLFFLSITSLSAQFTYSGNGGSDKDWNNADNWDKNGLPSDEPPTPGSTVTIPGSINSGTLELSSDVVLSQFSILSANGFSIDLKNNNFQVTGNFNGGGGGVKRFYNSQGFIGDAEVSFGNALFDSLIIDSTTLKLNTGATHRITGGGIGGSNSEVELAGTLNIEGAGSTITVDSFCLKGAKLVVLPSASAVTISSRTVINTSSLSISESTAFFTGFNVGWFGEIELTGGAKVNVSGDIGSIANTEIKISNDSEVSYTNLSSFGKVTGTATGGTGNVPHIRSTGGIGAGEFALPESLPFNFAGGVAGGNSTTVTNSGYFRWSGGDLKNFTNSSTGCMNMLAAGGPDSYKIVGETTNEGNWSVGSTLTIAPNGSFVNDGTMTVSSNISVEDDFVNVGAFKNTPKGMMNFTGIGIKSISGPVRFESGGSVEITGGGLSIGTGAEIGGTITTKGSDTFCKFSPDGFLEEDAIDSSLLILDAEPGTYHELGRGRHNLRFLSSPERPTGGGEIRALNAEIHTSPLVTLDSGVFAASENVPFILGGNLAESSIHSAGFVANRGFMIIANGTLRGSQTFCNEKHVSVIGTLRVGLSNPTTQDSVTINNLDELLVKQNGNLNIAEGSRLVNRSGGTLKLERDAEIAPFTGGSFDNEGTLSTVGDSGNRVVRGQMQMTDTEILEESGQFSFESNGLITTGEGATLTFSDGLIQKSGKINSQGVLRLLGPSEFSSLDLTVGSQGDVRVSGNLKMTGPVNVSGGGNLSLQGGTISPTGNGGFGTTSENSAIELEGADIGSEASTVTFTNTGSTVRHTRGTIYTNYTNQGIHELSSIAEISGSSFKNEGTLTCSGGIISAEDTINEGSMTIFDSGLSLRGNFRNQGMIEQLGSITIGTGEKVELLGGSRWIVSEGFIDGFGSDIALMAGSDLTFDPGAGANSGISANSLKSAGNLVTASGSVDISPTSLDLSQSSVSVSPGAVINITPVQYDEFEMSSWHAGGTLTLSSPGSGVALSPNRITGNGTIVTPLVEQTGELGAGLAEDDFDFGPLNEGELILRGIPRSSDDLELRIQGSLLQTPTARSSFQIAGSGSSHLQVTGSVTLDGQLILRTNPADPLPLETDLAIVTASSVSGSYNGIEIVGSPPGISATVRTFGNQVLVRMTTVTETYEDWVDDNFTAPEQADPLISGSDADPDLDGWPNAFEYLSGSNPKIGSGASGFQFSIEKKTDSENTTAYFPVFSFTHVTGRGGFDLQIESLRSLLGETNDVNVSTVPSVGDGRIKLQGMTPARTPKDMFRLRATREMASGS